MRTYDTYKDSGISWLGQIPSHWESRKFKFTFSERKQKGFPDEPLLAATQSHGVIPKDLYETRTMVATKGLETLKLVEKGDFVISLRSFQGGIEYAYYRGIISPAYTVLTPTAISANYFKYLGKCQSFIALLKSSVTGIREGQNIDYSKLRENLLPLPPVNEQDTIAAYLDSATAEIDKAIASQQRMVELLQERKQIIINQAVTQGLNPDAPMKPTNIDWLPQIPTHWDVKMFKRLYRTRTGITFTKAQLEDKGKRVISYGQIHSKLNWYSSVNPELIRYIPESLTSGCDGALAYKGDFLFADTSEDFEGCGNCIYVDTEEPIYAGYHTILAKKNNEEHGEYLAFLFASTNWRGQVRSAVNGVKVYSITQTILNNTSVILPPVNEQKQIADYIQSAIKPIDAEISRCEQKIALLTERKQILINDIVTGKIKVL